jgi:hypothetical protein
VQELPNAKTANKENRYFFVPYLIGSGFSGLRDEQDGSGLTELGD